MTSDRRSVENTFRVEADRSRGGDLHSAPAGLRRSLLRNSATMAASKVLSAVVSLLMVPVIVARVGIDGFGVWEAFLAAAMLGSLFQNAIAGTLLWRAASEHAANDSAAVSRTLQLGITFIAAELAVLVPPIVAFRHELLPFLNVPPRFLAAAAVVLPGTLVVTILGGVNDSIGAIVSGCQRSGTFAMAQTAAQAVNYAVVLGCLVGGLGLYSMMLGLLAANLATFAVLLVVARGLVGRIRVWPCVPKRSELRALWPYTRSMMMGSIAIVVRGQLTKLITATAASPTWTGYYGIANRLAATVLIMLSFFSYPAVSAFAALKAKGNSEGVDALYLQLLRAVAVASGLVAVVVASGYDRILLVWLGRYLPDVAPMLILLVCTNVLVTILTGIGSSLCKGIGKPQLETRYAVVGLLLNLALLPLLTARMGAMGAVLAGAASYVLSGIYFVATLRRETVASSESHYVMAATGAAIAVSAVAARLLGSLWPVGETRLEGAASLAAVSASGAALFLGMASALGIVRWRSIMSALKAGR
jgi:O-antigen/teichoic acid export membrane protein